jgi:ureidoglycolate lyase
MTIRELALQALTAEAFAPFGDVIEAVGVASYLINDGQTERFHALSLAQTIGEASAGMSIFRNLQALDFPARIHMLERHPLGSQAFIPLAGQVFVIVVAKALDANQPDESAVSAFISNGKQGINYHAGVWHHPLMTLEAPSDFLVVDRVGQGHNCDVYQLSQPVQINQPFSANNKEVV